jgi:hypothetical protein
LIIIDYNLSNYDDKNDGRDTRFKKITRRRRRKITSAIKQQQASESAVGLVYFFFFFLRIYLDHNDDGWSPV